MMWTDDDKCLACILGGMLVLAWVMMMVGGV